MRVVLAAGLALALTTAAPGTAAAGVDGAAPGPPVELRVDGWPDDGVVGQASPTLSWVTTDGDRGDGQSAYQVRVTDGEGRGLWDSGKVASAASTRVAYGGAPLTSDATYAWRVRVWDRSGAPSRWSSSQFATGLLDPGDWTASWLETGEGALVRHDFVVGRRVARAWLYVASQGIFEPHLDGRLISDHVRDSTWTDWTARSLYRSFDVTDRLQPGSHALGAMLSQGGIRDGAEPVRFVAQLNIHYQDGSSEVVSTDNTWRTAAGPVTVADPYLGERYDARNEPRGWDRPGFDDTVWQPAKVAAPVVSTSPNLAAGSAVSAKDSTDCCGWSKAALVDGLEQSAEGSQGYHSASGSGPDDAKWVQVDLGKSQRFDEVTLFPAHPTNDPAGDFPGIGFPVRYRVDASDDPTFATATTVVDRTGADQPNPRTEAVRIPADTTARYLRVTATRLSNEYSGTYSFRLAELSVRGNLEQPGYTLGTLMADPTPPMRVVRTVAPVRTTSPAPGVTQYDFGQNFSGWVRIKGAAPSGTAVNIFKGELLDAAGRVTTRNIGFSDSEGPRQTDRYTFRGDDTETYEPRFVYSGFRYAEISGLPAGAGLEVEARVVHTDVESTGEFRSSSSVLNGIQEAVRQTQLNNLHGLPEDCPTREKKGWLGDAAGTSAEAMANFGMDDVYRKWLADIATSQAADGSVPSVAPSTQYPGVYKTDPAWGSAYPTVTWEHWQRYGDVSVLREHYDGIRRWVDYLATIADTDHIVVRPPVSYGADWMSLESTPPEYFHTGFYYRDARVVADMATVLGKGEDAARYAGLADEIAAGLNKRFYKAATGTYANGSQFAQALPLTLGIVPAGGAQKVLDGLILDIAEHDFHLTTGFVGTQPVFRALDAYGRNDIALRIAERDDYPSFGYMVKQGPGTIWEKWPDSRVGDGTSSKDHIGLGGAIGEWFYTGLAGIEPTSPGYRTFALNPSPVGDLKSARGQVSTPYGPIVSDWKHQQDRFDYRATVPFGTTATVTIPLVGGPGSAVTEGSTTIFADGHATEEVPGLTVVGSSSTSVTVRAGSGSYAFAVRPAGPADTELSIMSSPQVNSGTAVVAVVTSRSNRAGTGHVVVDAPVGFQATATPATFTLAATNQPVATRIDVQLSADADIAPGNYPVTVTASAPGADPVSTISTVHVGRTVKQWTFDTAGDTEGWRGENQVTAPVVADGQLRTTATGGDPFLVQPGPLNIDAPAGLTVEITLTSSMSGAGQLFWTTAGGPGFNEGQSARFSLTANQPRTYTVSIPAGSQALSGLRLDPQEGPGAISIDRIRILV
jgi:alpha-L-rhamnosidase